MDNKLVFRGCAEFFFSTNDNNYISHLEVIGHNLGLSKVEVDALITQAKLNSTHDDIPSDQEHGLSILSNIIQVAWIDGKITPAEYESINKYADKFGIKENQVKELISLYKRQNSHYSKALIGVLCLSLFAIIIYFTHKSPPLNTITINAVSDYSDFEKLNSAVALNTLFSSFYNIDKHQDEELLNNEYVYLISKVDRNEISDPELIEVIKGLMDSSLEARIAQRKIKASALDLSPDYKKAIYETVSDEIRDTLTPEINLSKAGILKNVQKLSKTYGAAINLTKFGVNTLANVIAEEKISEYKTQLASESYSGDLQRALNNARKIFLENSWRLVKKKNIPPDLLVDEKKMSRLSSILEISDLNTRIANLINISSSFKAFPKYWFKLGEAALFNGQFELAQESFSKHLELSGKLLQSDPSVIESCKFQFYLTASKSEKLNLLNHLSIASEEDSWMDRYFIGKGYILIGENEKGIHFLEQLRSNQQAPMAIRAAACALLTQAYYTDNKQDNISSSIQFLRDNLDSIIPLYELSKSIKSDELNKLLFDKISSITCTLSNGELSFNVPNSAILGSCTAEIKILNSFKPLINISNDGNSSYISNSNIQDVYFSGTNKEPSEVALHIIKPIDLSIFYSVATTSNSSWKDYLSLSSNPKYTFNIKHFHIASETIRD